MIAGDNIRCRPCRGLVASERPQTHGSRRGLIAAAPAGALWRVRFHTHGSRRGLIAAAPTGAEQHLGAVVLNSDASELEERIANDTATQDTLLFHGF